ncbi:hypothetical protein RDWZM_005352 [Blomia tropicalis]|uniref:Uncharacterized protein n=1 Tax=Blomia tropicalis TaxID=40697 RepID=A0A9Q0M5G2_BLOTA|nr:hypothetical protein RDWZM_005352 [Blomia tropicalis]
MDYHFAVPIIPKATVKGLDAAVVASKPKKPNKSKKVSKKINVQHTESIDSESKCLPTKSLSDLCPSCSQIVHQYLAPLQDYINVILKVTENCDEHTIPTRTLSVPHFQNNFIDKSIDTEFDQTKIECHTTQSTYKNSNENPSISTEEINRTTFKNEESDKETTHSNEKNYKLQKYENEVPNVSQHLIPDFKDDNEHILQHSEHHENGVPKSDSINYINENSVYKNNDFLLNKSNQRKQNDSKTSIDYCGNENDEQQSIDNITNEVIVPKNESVVLLNDESLGIQQNKIHLWKELNWQYEKCIFLESFTMVVGEISNLFLETVELSASVDCQFPDNFNCSVFVFEPNWETYNELLKYGLYLKGINENGENGSNFDELDEMTLLNQFFASKWQKLSFIYNFVRNDLTYTQVPAYFKFGDNIRVVNFGDCVTQINHYSSNRGNEREKLNSPMQPWNYRFNLATVQLEDQPFEHAPVDNYSKFYLRCFIRRLWPHLSETITPFLLANQNGRVEWTILELLNFFGGDKSCFVQNPITLRRKKSWVTDSSFDFNRLNIDDESKVIETVKHSTNMPTNETKTNHSRKTDEDTDKVMMERGKQINEENRRQWEDGRIDWMGAYQSDKIIDRLMNSFR